MQTFRLIRPLEAITLILCFLAALTSDALGQSSTSNTIPSVFIYATTPNATFAGKAGVFSVFRQGNTTSSLSVYYCISGTATNGVDYQTISNTVTLASGVTSNSITIHPINHGQTNEETVVIDLCPSPMLPPVNYMIGSPSNAVVYIYPPTNSTTPPVVSLVSPTNGEVYVAPVNISLLAQAQATVGVSNVEFFAGSMDLGRGQLLILDPPGVNGVTGPVYFLNWSNVPPSTYSLTAVATDNGGASTVSSPVNISVLSSGSNVPPVVAMSYPTNGEVFFPPTTNIALYARASDPDGSVSNVEFFAGTTDLGAGQVISAGPSGGIYYLTWSNVPPNIYSLTAVATDNGGASTVSVPVKITVLGQISNLPPIVRIASPPNGATFRSPVNVPMVSYAFAFQGYISSVQLLADGNSLGFARPLTATIWSTQGSNLTSPTNLWFFVWTNPPPEINISLTALATDSSGLSSTSAPVLINILPPLPPPTNRPPFVGIIASDPVAIEGTNCWPWVTLAGGLTNGCTWSNWISPTAVFCRITNCGPKDATFTIFRVGATNDNLTVSYAIGGTASNGLDYVALPGTVLIPAGLRSAPVTVVPLDDGVPDINSTVVLKVTPGTNYLVGLPASAAAIILDSGSPVSATGMLPGNYFHLCVNGPNGAWFHVEQSMDLVNWSPICTNQVINGSIDFVDPNAALQAGEFYRVVPESNPAVQ